MARRVAGDCLAAQPSLRRQASRRLSRSALPVATPFLGWGERGLMAAPRKNRRRAWDPAAAFLPVGAAPEGPPSFDHAVQDS